jgi:hypothetical protein
VAILDARNGKSIVRWFAIQAASSQNERIKATEFYSQLKLRVDLIHTIPFCSTIGQQSSS